jgi:hypothetical protein
MPVRHAFVLHDPRPPPKPAEWRRWLGIALRTVRLGDAAGSLVLAQLVVVGLTAWAP